MAIDDVVNVSFDIESREYNGRWYTSIRAWKVDKMQQPWYRLHKHLLFGCSLQWYSGCRRRKRFAFLSEFFFGSSVHWVVNRFIGLLTG